MTWPLVERVTVRKLPGGSFIGEARTHAHFAVGEITADPVTAMHSAAAALDAELRPKWKAQEYEGLL